MKILIIGAGPAGLSCAHEIIKRGHDVEIFEASPFVGGMSRSFELWDQKVDLGPHRFFSKDDRVNNFFNEILQDEFVVVNRLTRIYYRNRFFSYPLRFGNVIKNLGFGTIVRILFDYAKVKVKPIKDPSTFEEWVTNRFGKKLFELFFKSYTEKLWGITCSEIDSEWASQRIKTLSLTSAVMSSIKGDKKNKHKTLVNQFNYPKIGAGYLYEKCAAELTDRGVKIHLNSAVRKVELDKDGKVAGVLLQDGSRVDSDLVVSTMPLTDLIKGFEKESIPQKVLDAANNLYFRNTILVYLEVNATDLFDDNWIYIHSDKVKHGRITNFRNWSPEMYGNQKTSILCLEFWAFDKDELWSASDDDLSELAIKEIRELNLFSESCEIARTHTVKIPKCYPVYERGYQEHLSIIENYIDTIENLIPIGRYGAFKYNNQDHSILMGILAAQKISKEGDTNLWDINTDTDYQEDGRAPHNGE